nr:hypothetical protein CFP56_58718 [Quercus suber]
MSSSSSSASSGNKKGFDLISRGQKTRNFAGTATFVGSRAIDPFLQYGILSQGWGNSLITALRGRVLPQGPPLVTNTPFDRLGLSPYRSILFGMSVGAMLKQNFHVLAIMQEEMSVGSGAAVGVFNAVFNSLNSLFLICAQTSATVNGEHFPQTPLIVGSTLYTAGLFMEWFSEVQRAAWKKDARNKGKVYTGGLFGLSRHINYFGYTLWRTGYALAAGGWVWAAVVGSYFTYDFTQRAVPLLQDYLEKRYGEQYKQYETAVCHPIHGVVLPHNFTFDTAQLLYRHMKIRHDGRRRIVDAEFCRADLSHVFRASAEFSVALEIWMWTHARFSLRNQSPWETFDAGTTSAAEREFATTDPSSRPSTRPLRFNDTGELLHNSARRNMSRLAKCASESDANADWERYVGEEQIPYQPDEGDQSPTENRTESCMKRL